MRSHVNSAFVSISSGGRCPTVEEIRKKYNTHFNSFAGEIGAGAAGAY